MNHDELIAALAREEREKHRELVEMAHGPVEPAADLARRAIAAAERRATTDDGVAERLRQAAGDDGRLTPEEALAAVNGLVDPPRA